MVLKRSQYRQACKNSVMICSTTQVSKGEKKKKGKLNLEQVNI